MSHILDALSPQSTPISVAKDATDVQAALATACTTAEAIVGNMKMTDKNKGIMSCAIALAIQALVAFAIFLSSCAMSANWMALLGDSTTLPASATVALSSGLAIPITTAVIVVVAFVAVCRGAKWWAKLVLGLMMLELILLSLYVIGISCPAMSITYRLGP